MTGKSVTHQSIVPVEGALCISCKTVLQQHILRDDDRILRCDYSCPDDECIRFGLLSVAWAMPTPTT